MLQEAKGKDSVCRALVFRFHKKFSEGHTALNDEHRSGRKKSVKASSVSSIQSALDTDRLFTVQELKLFYQSHFFIK
jgi:transposase